MTRLLGPRLRRNAFILNVRDCIRASIGWNLRVVDFGLICRRDARILKGRDPGRGIGLSFNLAVCTLASGPIFNFDEFDYIILRNIFDDGVSHAFDECVFATC